MASKAKLFLAVLACLVSSFAISKKVFYTYLRTLCEEDCKLYDEDYKCKTLTANGKTKIFYCSPDEGQDYKGNPCNSPCWATGKGYSWCTVGTSWGYCGEVKEVDNHYSSYYGEVCHHMCSTHGYDYNWCYTKKGWDYCSPEENRDYKDIACRDDHPCRKHGERYYWCKNKSGGWGYCGPLAHGTNGTNRLN